MEKRIIIALVLSVLILALWGIIFPPPKQRPQEQYKERPSISGNSKKEEISKPQSLVPQNVKSASCGEKITIETDLYRAVFTTEGGLLTSFQIKRYPEKQIREADLERAMTASRDAEHKRRLDLIKKILPDTRGVEMVSAYSIEKGIFPLFLSWQEEEPLFNNSLYDVERKENTLIFSWTTAENIKITRKYIMRKDAYIIDSEITLENIGAKSFSAAPLVIRYGPGVGLTTELEKADSYQHGIFFVKEAGRGKIVRESFRRLRPGTGLTRSYHDAIWGGLENKYFLAAFITPSEPYSFILEKDTFGQLNLALKMQMPELLPTGSLSRKFSLYIGPKQEGAVKAAGAGLEKSIDYGTLASAMRIMDILRFFYRITRNWGLAIILLTILTKIILFPLNQKSLRSMEKMQALQPKMKELRMKYKDDPRKQQKELMELYRKEGVNPMGGCLPMALQMPIFIALFTTLRNTIDLRGAAFLWIKDLSLPDTVCYISSIPVNPLPLIMGVTMFWQQKTTTADPEQAKMMMLMPVMFTFFLYNFSSGLVLYWTVQNILTMAQQYVMKNPIKANDG